MDKGSWGTLDHGCLAKCSSVHFIGKIYYEKATHTSPRFSPSPRLSPSPSPSTSPSPRVNVCFVPEPVTEQDPSHSNEVECNVDCNRHHHTDDIALCCKGKSQSPPSTAHVYTCIYMYIHVHTCTYMYIHAHTHTCTCTYMYIHAHTCTYMHIHAHTGVGWWGVTWLRTHIHITCKTSHVRRHM